MAAAVGDVELDGRALQGVSRDPQMVFCTDTDGYQAHDNWFDPEIVSDPLLTPAKDLPIDHPNLEERLLWDFSSKTYKQWFDGGAEEFPEAEQELEEVYGEASSLTSK